MPRNTQSTAATASPTARPSRGVAHEGGSGAGREATAAPPQAPAPATDRWAEPCDAEIATAGRWHAVPALKAGGAVVFLQGRWLRVAVVRDEDFTAAGLAGPERWAAALRRQRIGGRRADVFAFSQRLPDTSPRFHHRYQASSVAALQLDDFDAWWASLPQETRKNIRRAERRGVEVRVQRLDDELVRGIKAVNDECPVVQGKKSRFFGRSVEEVWKDHISFADRSWYVCAYHAGELIGYMKIVHCGAFASVLTTLTRPSHADKRPANAILARVVRLCVDEGIPYLVYGQLNYGNKREGTLREFKLRNGFSEILVPRYYVPLTLRGRLALCLGLHKGLLGILPPWAVKLALRGRALLRRSKTWRSTGAKAQTSRAAGAERGGAQSNSSMPV